MTTASFYLTPELKAKLVNLAISVNGKFEPFVNQVKVIEQDPSWKPTVEWAHRQVTQVDRTTVYSLERDEIQDSVTYDR